MKLKNKIPNQKLTTINLDLIASNILKNNTLLNLKKESHYLLRKRNKFKALNLMRKMIKPLKKSNKEELKRILLNWNTENRGKSNILKNSKSKIENQISNKYQVFNLPHKLSNHSKTHFTLTIIMFSRIQKETQVTFLNLKCSNIKNKDRKRKKLMIRNSWMKDLRSGRPNQHEKVSSTFTWLVLIHFNGTFQDFMTQKLKSLVLTCKYFNFYQMNLVQISG